MAVDKNTYALSIMLDMETSDAFSALEDFSQKAANVEERVSTAAQNSINAISGLVDTLNQQMSQAIAATGEFADAASKAEETFSKTASSLRDSYKTEQDSLLDLQERLTHLEKIDDIQSDLEKSLIKEHKTGEEYLALINRWISALEGKNLVHDEEGNLVEQEKKIVEGLDDTWGGVNEKLHDGKGILRKIAAASLAIWAIIKNFDKETENFVQANYRVYGAQQKLVNNTRQLSAEYGIFREEAIATYKALADVKTPREEIYKLSATVGRANRVTGLGIDVLADYSFQLRGAGFDADRTRKQIDLLSAAQRKFGLSTYDVQKAIESQTLSGAEQVLFFGKDAPEAFMKANLGLRALDKQLATNSTDDMMQRLQKTGVESLVFWDKFGLDASEALAEPMLAQARIAEIVAQEIGASLNQVAAGDLSDEQKAALVVTAKAYDVTNAIVVAGAKAHSDLTDAQKQQMLTMAGVEKALKDQIAADKRWQESMNTLTAQLNMLKSAINAVVGFVLQFVADALIPLLKALNFVVKWVGVFIGMIRSAIGWMEEWIPGFKLLMNAVKFVGGLLIGLILILVMSGVALASLGTAFSTTTGVIRGSLNVIRMVGRAIVAIAEAIGQSIKAIFTGIGQGLAALGNAVKPVIIPLLQLSVAVLLVGAGFWLMGMGLKAAAEHGWAAFGMLVAMTVAMLAMIVTFAVIATVAAPAIPLIVALAVAVLILGAAALLAGLGMYFMGMAVEQIANYGLQAAVAMPPLAAGVLLLGAAGLFASFGIMLLAAALWMLAPPVMMLGIGFYLMAAAMQMITADQILPIAEAILQASLIFLAAGAVLAPAGILLMAGAVLIMAASYLLLGAGLVLTLAAWLLSVAAGILGPASEGMLESAKKLNEAGMTLLPASMMLWSGAVVLISAMLTMIAAGALMIVAGAAMMAGTLAFKLGTIFLGGVADTVLQNGMKIGRSGEQLLVGVRAILSAANLMGSAGRALKSSVKELAGALESIDESSVLLVGSGRTRIMVAGTILQSASEQLYIGSFALSIASERLELSSQTLWRAGRWLRPAAISIYIGMLWLQSATKRFRSSVDDIDKMGKGMHMFAESFEMLSHAPIDSIGNAADAALAAMPNVNKLARELDKSAGLFQSAADKFVKPVRQISDSLEELGGALSEIGTQGLMVQGDMDKLGTMLDKYTTLLEGTAQRIELAVVAKAQPAMATAREEGLEDAVRSEAITTVKVMDKTEGDAERVDEQVVLMTEMATNLRGINEKMDMVSGGGGTELTTIVELLEQYLPEMSKSDQGLTTEFNQWMK